MSHTLPDTLRITALLALLLACGRSDSGHYDATGVVTDLNREYAQVVIAHEDIPGLMPAMTMNFDVADPELLDRLQPGDAIDFHLVFDGRSYRVTEAEVRGAGDAGDGARLADVAAALQPAPDFDLVDQDGNRRRLSDLAGRVVLLDFVYTRCPGPCPILTSSHVRVQRAIPEAVEDRVWFVSISLDPVRDTPTAMGRYGAARGADLTRWWFLTGAAETVTDVIGRYGVSRGPGAGGEIDHLVVTFLIDGDGRIAKRYIGLEHEAKAVTRDLLALAERLPASPGGG